jgi:DUF4097 and DUF4098 domain-containing protein YvlB
VGAGNVDLRQVGARSLRVSSRAGNVHLKNCAGELSAETGSGNLTITGHEGAIGQAVASAGNVTVRAGQLAQACVATSGAGNVDVEADSVQADLRLECRAGNVTFEVRDLRANLTATTGVGAIRGALPAGAQAVFRVRSMVAHNAFRNAPAGPGVPVVTLTSQVGSVRLTQL